MLQSLRVGHALFLTVFFVVNNDRLFLIGKLLVLMLQLKVSTLKTILDGEFTAI